jgi:segregation and condensation protein B
LATVDLKALIESLIFAADAPVRSHRLAEVLGEDVRIVSDHLQDLIGEYRDLRRGFLLEEVAEGYQFRTRPEFAEWIRAMQKSRPFRFSRAALETLAIVAYRQPITRSEIEYLRGVDSGGVLRTLLDRHLVRILGKKDIPGRPLIYGTSREFLEFFGLRNLTDLPTLKEFNGLAPDTAKDSPA